MHREKYLQQLAIADLIGIERDPHHFHMARIAIAYLAIGCLIGASPHVPRLDVRNPSQALKNGLNAPETPAAKNRCLLFCHAG
jgi:hypothetical protein